MCRCCARRSRARSGDDRRGERGRDEKKDKVRKFCTERLRLKMVCRCHLQQDEIVTMLNLQCMSSTDGAEDEEMHPDVGLG